ncbi:cyclic nucleotide-binding domain-containing protein [Sphingobacterium sp. KU25419]|nr:cyclic nucleotide-binding domain-containing protein [Sphingobacterium sp. KU25419]
MISLSDDEFSWIYEHFTFQEFKKNELIFEEGQPVKHVYFVLSGLVVLSYTIGMPSNISFLLPWRTGGKQISLPFIPRADQHSR